MNVSHTRTGKHTHTQKCMTFNHKRTFTDVNVYKHAGTGKQSGRFACIFPHSQPLSHTESKTLSYEYTHTHSSEESRHTNTRVRLVCVQVVRNGLLQESECLGAASKVQPTEMRVRDEVL